jgi:ribosomal protein S18 acetylase RimI-like enzyme
MTQNQAITIKAVGEADIERYIQGLGELLHASVHQGASIGFVLPFSLAESEAFWRKTVQPGLGAGGLVLLIALDGGKLTGSVQLGHDTPANQPHRADVKKLLVHPAHRRQGIARALMAELERRAKTLGRSLLTLDTRTGDMAEPLYTSLGYRTVGVIPDFCLETIERKRLDSTTVMYKALGRHQLA